MTSPDPESTSPTGLVAQLHQLVTAQAAALDQTPTSSPSDETIDHKVDHARRKAQQAHTFRAQLFGTVRWCLIGTLAASAVIMGFYIWAQWGEIAPTVMVSWNAAIVVNTVGLAYIVANYLFPRGGAD